MKQVYIKYLNLLSSRLPYFTVKNSGTPYKVNFRCPLCGDSQRNKYKARGWVFEIDDGEFLFNCFNCGNPMPFQAFVKHVDPEMYNEMRRDIFMENMSSSNSTFTPEIIKKKETLPPINKLKGVKKVSTLDISHKALRYLRDRKIPHCYDYLFYYTKNFRKWVNDELIPEKFSKTDGTDERIIMPLYGKNNTIYGVIGRSLGDSQAKYITILVQDHPKIFGLNTVNFKKPYILVEGPIDSLFLPNSIAMIGSDFQPDVLENHENCIVVFDNEPKNTAIVKKMEKYIKDYRLKVCMWPRTIGNVDILGMDINDMVRADIDPREIYSTIKSNSYSGLIGMLELNKWKLV